MSLLTSARPTCARCRLSQQLRHASLLRRPKRPYTFTQMITLSDGSTFLHRTTSPQPVYRTTKDTKNVILWNPSSQKFLNVEEDEAGRLRRFRERFGRGFDADAATAGDEEAEKAAEAGAKATEEEQSQDSFMDLISGYAPIVEKRESATSTPKRKKK